MRIRWWQCVRESGAAMVTCVFYLQTELNEMEEKKRKMMESMMKRKQQHGETRAKLEHKRQRKRDAQQ